VGLIWDDSGDPGVIAMPAGLVWMHSLVRMHSILILASSNKVNGQGHVNFVKNM